MSSLAEKVSYLSGMLELLAEEVDSYEALLPAVSQDDKNVKEALLQHIDDTIKTFSDEQVEVVGAFLEWRAEQ